MCTFDMATNPVAPSATAPPHLSPPLSRHTLLSGTQKIAWICKQTSGCCNSFIMPEAGGQPPANPNPPNIWERRRWGCGKNGCLGGELCGECARTNEGQRWEDQPPERVTKVTSRGRLRSNSTFRDRTQGITNKKKKGKLSFLRLYFHVVCLHGCNHTAKPLNSDQPETQNERLMVLEIEECVPSPNHKSGFQI